MKATGFFWNNEYVTRSTSFHVKGKVSFRITYGMIENFIKKIDTKNYSIKHLGYANLSNKQRKVAVVTIEMGLIFLEDLLEKLGLKNIDKDCVIDYYRYSIEKPSKNYTDLKYWMFNARTKNSKLVANTPFAFNGNISKGTSSLSHYLCKKV